MPDPTGPREGNVYPLHLLVEERTLPDRFKRAFRPRRTCSSKLYKTSLHALAMSLASFSFSFLPLFLFSRTYRSLYMYVYVRSRTNTSEGSWPRVSNTERFRVFRQGETGKQRTFEIRHFVRDDRCGGSFPLVATLFAVRMEKGA